MGLDHILFEGDSLEVVNAMKNENHSGARYGMMINAAKEELLSIRTWEFQYVRRGANAAATGVSGQTGFRTRRAESLARNFTILYS